MAKFGELESWTGPPPGRRTRVTQDDGVLAIAVAKVQSFPHDPFPPFVYEWVIERRFTYY
jgi:hypothetical protein